MRVRRKALGISAVTTAKAAGMSRITLDRIERGEASVTMGAYLSALSSLGLELDLVDPSLRRRAKLGAKLPEKIRLNEYSQLRSLAWQLKGTKELTPEEALSLYERNWRHVDPAAMSPTERDLLEALLAFFGKERLLV